MKVYQIAGNELRAWLQAIIDSGRRVLAPVVDGGGRADFAVLSSAADVADDTVVQTTQSPKRAAFPRVDTLFEYTKDGGNVELRQPAAEGDADLLDTPLRFR